MSDGIIALIAVASVLAYCIGAGVMYAIAIHRGWGLSYGGLSSEGFLAIVFWPLVLPAALAAIATRALLRPRSELPKATAREVSR